MIYVKFNKQTKQVEKFPYTFTELVLDNPNTSFYWGMSTEDLAAFGVAEVTHVISSDPINELDLPEWNSQTNRFEKKVSSA